MYIKTPERGEDIITLTMVIEGKEFFELHKSAIKTGYLNPRADDYEQQWEAIQAEYIAMRQTQLQAGLSQFLKRSK